MAQIFAGRPDFTTLETSVLGMDHLGATLISYLSFVVPKERPLRTVGSGSTVHCPENSCTTPANAIGTSSCLKIRILLGVSSIHDACMSTTRWLQKFKHSGSQECAGPRESTCQTLGGRHRQEHNRHLQIWALNHGKAQLAAAHRSHDLLHVQHSAGLQSEVQALAAPLLPQPVARGTAPWQLLTYFQVWHKLHQLVVVRQHRPDLHNTIRADICASCPKILLSQVVLSRCSAVLSTTYWTLLNSLQHI